MEQLTANQLKKMRQELGLTQVQMAELACITERMYQRLESGASSVTRTIAKLLKIEHDRLMVEAEKQTPSDTSGFSKYSLLAKEDIEGLPDELLSQLSHKARKLSMKGLRQKNKIV